MNSLSRVYSVALGSLRTQCSSSPPYFLTMPPRTCIRGRASRQSSIPAAPSHISAGEYSTERFTDAPFHSPQSLAHKGTPPVSAPQCQRTPGEPASGHWHAERPNKLSSKLRSTFAGIHPHRLILVYPGKPVRKSGLPRKASRGGGRRARPALVRGVVWWASWLRIKRASGLSGD
ncbi:hypothetical protein BU26DRAFT_515671 [Trematosphaeria pertusa]|uniref:Uncharacterized protein n=1 Tax=Trematosphaeria pertusa TaxID=390896 RepID=A0A6A6IT95_9PLEO|nr:uncharacterized protein BU26DRAFT_515671 [Trematosphaeria pertusa]KAF2253307.1 hypothetical protein BU26DRAFT_515671 [Trematosphaeria pertusa]